MPSLTRNDLRAASKFLAETDLAGEQWRKTSDELQAFVTSAVGELGGVHLIRARSKSEASAREKIVRKQYRNPRRTLTDLLGIRVIVYFAEDLAVAVERLKAQMNVNERLSSDKGLELGTNSFGYRSVHLVGTLGGGVLRRRYAYVGSRRFEVQLRSLLEHAWAEIEHELVYKSGVTYPQADKRHLAAIAGVLEMADGLFAGFRQRAPALRDSYLESFEVGSGLEAELDGARLAALLKATFPNGAELPHDRVLVALAILRAARIKRGVQLQAYLRTRRFRSRCIRYCSQKQLGILQVPHLAAVAMIGRIAVPNLFDFVLPDFEAV